MRQVLSVFDGLWVRGGNVFVLRSAMAVSAADTAVVDLLAENSLVYAGYSAGPCVLARSLAGLESVDDADAPRRLGLGEALVDGLGVLEGGGAARGVADASGERRPGRAGPAVRP